MLVADGIDRRFEILRLYGFILMVAEEIHDPALVISEMEKLTDACSRITFMHHATMIVAPLPCFAGNSIRFFPEAQMLYFVHWFNHGHLSRLRVQYSFSFRLPLQLKTEAQDKGSGLRASTHTSAHKHYGTSGVFGESTRQRKMPKAVGSGVSTCASSRCWMCELIFPISFTN